MRARAQKVTCRSRVLPLARSMLVSFPDPGDETSSMLHVAVLCPLCHQSWNNNNRSLINRPHLATSLPPLGLDKPRPPNATWARDLCT